jgi:hypothetical protein
MAVPNIFGTATSAIPLSQLDTNFATAITLGNTAVYLGNTTTSLGNLTLTNVLISSTNGDATISGLTVGKGNASVSTNTAVGASALAANQAGGTNNTAIGNAALDANTTGDANTAVGDNALGANTTASNNTAVGYQAGYTNATGESNTFIGIQAGYTSNATASNGFNVAIGRQAGYNLTTASSNTFVGSNAGQLVTSGAKNTILGGYDGNQSSLDIRTASNNIVLSDGDGNPRGMYVPTQGIGWNFGGNAVTDNYSGSGDTTINTVPYSRGSGGGLAVVRGYDGSTGNPYVRLYVVAIQVAGGAAASTSALVSSAGSAGATFTFAFTGGYVTVTGASTNGGNWAVSYYGL